MKPANQNKHRKLGPWGHVHWDTKTGDWRYSLTQDGQAEFDRWLREEKNPSRLLSRVCSRQLDRAVNSFGEEAVSQAGLIALWYALLKFDPALGTLVTTVAWEVRSQLMLLEREASRCRDTTSFDNRLHFNLLSKEPDPFESAAQADEVVRVRRAVHKLCPSQRETLTRLLNGQRPRDIATDLGVSRKLVDMRRKRGYKFLESQLAEH